MAHAWYGGARTLAARRAARACAACSYAVGRRFRRRSRPPCQHSVIVSRHQRRHGGWGHQVARTRLAARDQACERDDAAAGGPKGKGHERRAAGRRCRACGTSTSRVIRGHGRTAASCCWRVDLLGDGVVPAEPQVLHHMPQQHLCVAAPAHRHKHTTTARDCTFFRGGQRTRAGTRMIVLVACCSLSPIGAYMEPCLTMATPMPVASADSKARQGRGGMSAAGARAQRTVKALRLYDCLVLLAPHTLSAIIVRARAWPARLLSCLLSLVF